MKKAFDNDVQLERSHHRMSGVNENLIHREASFRKKEKK